VTVVRKRRGRGEGGIRFREDKGLWVGEVRLPTGKRRTIYGKTKAEVLEKIRNVQNESAAGLIADAGKLTVGEYLNRWMETAGKRSLRHGTWVRYEQLVRLRIVPHLGDVPLARLAADHIDQLLIDLEKEGVSARGQQMAVNVLGRALKDATNRRPRLISHNPVRDVVKPKSPGPKRTVYGPEEVARFFAAAAEDRLAALYVLAVDTGMREGELFALEWPDIDFGAGCVMVQRALKEVKGQLWVEDLKTEKSRRRIDLSRATLDALDAHRKRQLAEGNAGKLVFASPEGDYLRRPNVARRSFRRIIDRANAMAREEAEKATQATGQHVEPALLPRIRFHDLRHTCATLLLLADERTKVVSERLGHASTQVTEAIYQHVLPTMQKRAAEKMDAILSQTSVKNQPPGGEGQGGGTAPLRPGTSDSKISSESAGLQGQRDRRYNGGTPPPSQDQKSA
jgi:integrase